MVVPSTTARASLCTGVMRPLPAGLNHWCSPSASSPSYTYFSLSRIVTGRMSLASCNLEAVSILYSYPRCQLSSRKTAGHSLVSLTTATLRAVSRSRTESRPYTSPSGCATIFLLCRVPPPKLPLPVPFGSVLARGYMSTQASRPCRRRALPS